MNKSRKCWICGDIADSGEHMIKASDLRAIIDHAPNKPFYFHDNKHKNLKVQSVKADCLKFSNVICHACNSARTQPYDRAWDAFSQSMQERQLSVGQALRINRIFPYDTKHHMRHVHLYFVKIFGCAIVEYDVPIDIRGFSTAIRNDRLHPNVYLAFGPRPESFPDEMKMAGLSDVHAYTDGKGCAFAVWFLYLEHLTVGVMYAREGEETKGTAQAWHPKQSRNRIRVFDVNVG